MPDPLGRLGAADGGVLLTGFDPFGGAARNPSGEIARRLHGTRSADGTPIEGLELPTVFGASWQALEAAIEARRPRLVVALGLAANRDEVSVERWAANLDDARIADNAGRQPCAAPVVAGAPPGYASSLPVAPIVEALRAAGIPAGASDCAGRFVCNHVFYGLAHGIATRWPGLRGGFVHLPAWHLSDAGPSLATLLRATSLIIDRSLAS